MNNKNNNNKKTETFTVSVLIYLKIIKNYTILKPNVLIHIVKVINIVNRFFIIIYFIIYINIY
jgi:hypothetical protein